MTDDIRKAIEETMDEYKEAEKEKFIDVLTMKYHLCVASAEGLVDYAKLASEIGYGEDIDMDDEVFKDWAFATIARLKKNEKVAELLDKDGIEHIQHDPRMLVGNMATSIMEFLSEVITPRLLIELAARTVGPDVFHEMLNDIRKGPNIQVRRVNLKGKGLNEIIGEIMKDIQRHRAEENDEENDEEN